MEHISAILANCWWMILLSALIAYLLGSINTAVLVTGIVTKGKKDIRQMGSGNAGFTNVLRSVGKVPAIITIVCDALKCIIAVLIGGFIFSFASVAFQGESPIFINELINCGKYVAGIFCILGHSYPVYFHFKGGKGRRSYADRGLACIHRNYCNFSYYLPLLKNYITCKCSLCDSLCALHLCNDIYL